MLTGIAYVAILTATIAQQWFAASSAAAFGSLLVVLRPIARRGRGRRRLRQRTSSRLRADGRG